MKLLSHSIYFIILFFALVEFSPAQGKLWQPVSQAELQMKTPQVESGADAEAIFWKVNIDYKEDNLIYSYYVRLKVFTEHGREQFSKIEIAKKNEIRNVAARVIAPDGKISEIAKKDIFDKVVVKTSFSSYKTKSFAIPNLEIGSIIEYKFEEVHLKNSISFFLLYNSLPFLDQVGGDSRVNLNFPLPPPSYNLEFQTDIAAQQISYTLKLDGGREKWQTKPHNMSDIEPVQSSENRSEYIFTRTNVPMFKRESLMLPDSEVKQSVRIYKTSSKSDDDVWNLSRINIKPRLRLIKKASEEKDIIQKARELTANATNDEEKILRLYNFCRKEIKNLANDKTLTSEQFYKQVSKNDNKLSELLENKQGSSYQINNMFAAMTKSLGFEPELVLGYDRREYLFDSQNKSDIDLVPIAILIKVGDDWRYFLPSESYLPFGLLPWYYEGITALRANETVAKWFTLPVATPEKNKIKRLGNFVLSENGTLEGKLEIEYSGYIDVNKKVNDADETPQMREVNFQNEIKERISTAEISDVKFENSDDNDKNYKISCKIYIPNYAQKTGKRLFLQPGFFEYGTSPLFSSATRKYDIAFNYPWSEDDDITISLPSGFALDNPDRPADITDAKNIGSLKISIQVNKEQTFMKYTRKFHFGGGGNILFPATAYDLLKGFFDQYHKADTHIITLKQT